MEKIGKQLKEKRLELGMTVEDISVKTRLTQKHIKALEEGNMGFFHDDLSYLRFFVKSYCDAVDIDFEDIKDELRESVNDYTQTLTMSAMHDHEVIEKNIANSEKLSKVKSADDKPGKVRKHSKPHVDKRKLKRVDFSLVSLIAVVGVVAIVLICALVIFIQSSSNETDKKKNEQPIAEKQESEGNNSYPAGDKKKEPVKEEKKEIEVTKNSVTQYTIDNAKEGDDLNFEIYFGGSRSGFSVTVDGVVLNDPPANIYEYQSTAKANIKAKKDMKILIYVGWMNNTSVKVNGKNIKVDDSIMTSNSSQTLEFTVTGEE